MVFDWKIISQIIRSLCRDRNEIVVKNSCERLLKKINKELEKH
ncbi:MAG: hypothetical protein ACMUEL_01365 [Flavobacteriales bacterium Tduv]